MYQIIDKQQVKMLARWWDIHQWLLEHSEKIRIEIINGSYNPKWLQLFYKECEDYKEYQVNKIKKVKKVKFRKNTNNKSKSNYPTNTLEAVQKMLKEMNIKFKKT